LIEFGERLNKIYGLGKEKGRLELWLSRDKRQGQLYYVYIRWYEGIVKSVREPEEYLTWLEEIYESFGQEIERNRKVKESYDVAVRALNCVKEEQLCISNEEERKIREFLEQLGKVI
ncbi:MAG: hypothetical protein QW115_05970, partial [Thermoplasmata archaeon]